jgi:hypothetical protein
VEPLLAVNNLVSEMAGSIDFTGYSSLFTVYPPVAFW